MKNPVLVFDADNTLWNTDRLYRDAQLALLRSILNELGVADLGHGKPLGLVRKLDQRIAETHVDGLKYPVVLLIRELVQFIAPGKVVPESSIGGISDMYYQKLSDLPGLRRGVRSTIERLNELGLRLNIFSESSVQTVNDRLEKHGLKPYIAEVVSERKDPAMYLQLKERWGGRDCLMVGDQLDRDVEYANLAGWYTIHYPGRFKNKWDTELKGKTRPDFVIRSFSELLDSPPLIALGSTI